MKHHNFYLHCPCFSECQDPIVRSPVFFLYNIYQAPTWKKESDIEIVHPHLYAELNQFQELVRCSRHFLRHLRKPIGNFGKLLCSKWRLCGIWKKNLKLTIRYVAKVLGQIKLLPLTQIPNFNSIFLRSDQ